MFREFTAAGRRGEQRTGLGDEQLLESTFLKKKMFLTLFLKLNERTRGFCKNTPAAFLLNLELCVSNVHF